MIQLCISDIERLAKAGVTVTLGTGENCIMPQTDPVEAPQTWAMADPLAALFWSRFRQRVASITRERDNFGHCDLFRILVSQHGDKVWVSLHPTNFNYEPQQFQDDTAIFPSDALMANIALWEKNHP